MLRLTIAGLIALVLFSSAVAQEPKCPEVVKRGQGERIMLIIPAMSARWKVWESFMERNAERYTMYAVTPPGFGGSPVPDLPQNTIGMPWTEHVLAALEAVIDEHNLRDVVLLGHSWGSGIAVQLAAQQPDAVSAIVNVDGMITNDASRKTLSLEARCAEADSEVIEQWAKRLEDPEEWASFNGWRKDLPRTKRFIMVYGMNMATPKHVVLQNWREMWIWDLNPALRGLDIPIFNMRALKPNDQDPEKTRRDYLKRLEAINAPDSMTTVFLYDTKHGVEGQRPKVFDEMVAAFLNGEPVMDYHPPVEPQEQ